MEPTHILRTIQAADGVMVLGMTYLRPINHSLIATASLRIVADHMHCFTTVVYCFVVDNSGLILNHVRCAKVLNVSKNVTVNSVHFSILAS